MKNSKSLVQTTLTQFFRPLPPPASADAAQQLPPTPQLEILLRPQPAAVIDETDAAPPSRPLFLDSSTNTKNSCRARYAVRQKAISLRSGRRPPGVTKNTWKSWKKQRAKIAAAEAAGRGEDQALQPFRAYKTAAESAAAEIEVRAKRHLGTSMSHLASYSRVIRKMSTRGRSKFENRLRKHYGLSRRATTGFSHLVYEMAIIRFLKRV